MDSFNLQRRALLRLCSLGIAGTAIPGLAAASLDQRGTISSSIIFDVHKYGATGDGKTLDTDAVNRAIEGAAAVGGGLVYFSAGTYLCFSIHLKSNVHLHLEQGAIILAADSPKSGETTGYNGGTYDRAEPNSKWDAYQDYGHNHWHNSLIWGEDIHDLSISGQGLIYGQGLSFGGDTAARGNYPIFIAEQPGVGNKAIALKNCHNVMLRDFSALKGGHFCLLATGVDNLTIDNVKLDTDRDGFDIDCCRNVRVLNCTVNSPWDDAICPKSSYALGYRRSTENVTIANNYVTGGYELGSVIAGTWKRWSEKQLSDAPHILREGRIKCGTESNGGFSNITITGNVIENCKGIALESSDGAYIEDVVITGNTMRDIVDAPLFLRLNRRNRNPPETLRPGVVRRVLISDLVSSNSAAFTACLFSGIASNLIVDVKLSNCYFGHEGLPEKIKLDWSGRIIPMPNWRKIRVPEKEEDYPELSPFGPTPCHGFFVRHVRNLEMSHVEIEPRNPDPRPAFWLEDVHRADFFAITAPSQQNFSLHHVSDFKLQWSRAGNDAALEDIDDLLL